jgi:predicted aconitase with swiveling domain
VGGIRGIRRNNMKLRGRTVNPGKAEGEAIVSKIPFSFIGELDPSTGKISSPSHELFGQNIKGKIFVCPTGKGSSGGSSIAYFAKQAGNVPKAIIITQVEPVLAAAILTADIPAVDRLDRDPLEVIETGDYVKVDADQGIVEVIKKS